jgi:hypothetical protein
VLIVARSFVVAALGREVPWKGRRVRPG